MLSFAANLGRLILTFHVCLSIDLYHCKTRVMKPKTREPILTGGERITVKAAVSSSRPGW